MPTFWLLLLLATPFWLMASLAFLIAFASLKGKTVALCSLLPLLALWLWRWKPRVAAGLSALLAVLLLSLVITYPYPRQGEVGTSQGFPTVFDVVCNFVPEGDLSELGVGLAYTGATKDHVLRVLRPLYAEIGADQAYAHLPHVVGSTASDLFFGRPGTPHYYSYVPPGIEGRRPALIFYHGALGNFTVYLHFWRRWAQKNGWIVVCPSNGFGRWYDEEGEKRALDLFDRALKELPIDPSQVLVVGMSNGGTAVTRVINQRSDKVGAALLFCPVLEVGQTLTPTFLSWTQSHPKPIVLEGDDDVNVPPDVVQPNVNAILLEGGQCDYRLLEGHDHHILFSAAAESYQAADQLAKAMSSAPGQSADLLPKTGLGTQKRDNHIVGQPQTP